MGIFKIFVSASALVTLAASEAVEVLTDANFMEIINGEKPVFVKYYAPWCGHCKRLAPDWDKLATEVGDKCIIGKLDATVETGIAGDMKIRGYPTLKLYKDRLQYEYNGQRDVKSMAEFCDKYKEMSSGKPLPADEGLWEKGQEWVGEYLQKVKQVLSFEPTILPLFFLIGTLVGMCLMGFIIYLTTPAPKKRKGSKDAKKDDAAGVAKPADEKKTD